MSKEVKNYSNELKKQSVLITITMLLALISCVIGVVNSCSSDKVSDYDTSMMRSVGVNEVLEMFESNDTYVLYVGRETCEACVELLPTLQEAQLELNFITQYMDITQVDRDSAAWETLVEKLNIKATTTLTEDGSGETVTETFGYFLDTKGFTPCIIVIDKGEQVAGFFGSKTITNYKDWLIENGI